jgi:predicted ATPase/class 3 adenylate cyclase
VAGASTPPGGMVALLFSDVEGSTRLARALGAAWGDVLTRHRAIVTNAIADEGGWVDGVEGDAFFATFPTVDAAVRAAVEAHRGIGAEPWPSDGGGVRVRMGVHAAQVERTPAGYVGVEVHRAARVAAAAHGGQLLLTEAARHLLTDVVPVDDLGLHRLKDFPEPQRLFCAVIDGRGAADFPPPRTEGSRRASLPAVLDSFVGRDRELVDVAGLVTAQRLVTLVGPGGCGKTRLAVEVARSLASSYADGPFFVDLAPVTDPSLVAERVASAMGVRPNPGQSAGDALADALAGRDLLVLLDNVEQVVGSGPVVMDLLTLAPGLRLLVTSREPVHAPGEWRYTVEPLETLGPEEDLAAWSASATVLFVDRARAVDQGFVLTAGNAAVVAAICRRLDGLPLAIELAVGWLRVMSPETLLLHLGESLDLLQASGDGRPDRQQTLRATVDWSYRLLDAEPARVFRALSVFVGGWTVDAAAAVCDCPDPSTTLRMLGVLTECSLVAATRTLGADPRFRMLETLRGYGLEQLAEAGEESAVRARHADYVIGLAARSGAALAGPDELACMAQLDRERDNITSALRWLTGTGQQVRALDAAARLWRHWRVRAYLDEGRALLEELLAGLPSDAPDDVRARGLVALGNLAYWQLDYVSAEDRYQEALRLFTTVADEPGIAEASLDVGYVRQIRGDGEAAARAFETALRRFRALGDELGAANTLIALGFAAFMARSLGTASAHVTEGLALLRRIGPTFDANNALSLLGAIQRLQGDFDDADASDRAALVVHNALGNTPGVVWMLSELAAVAVETGQPERALRLAAAAQTLQAEEHHGVPLQLLALPDVRSRGTEALGADAAEAIWTQGRRLGAADAIDLAISAAPSSRAALDG